MAAVTSSSDPPTAERPAPADSTAEPTLDDVARENPRWHCWKGIAGLHYASLRHSSPPILIRGEDPLDLRDQIHRAEADLP
jgi:hypothetical protein